MHVRTQVAAIVIVVIVISLVWYGFYIQRNSPESYAAWDVGVLLVDYMSQNDEWPRGWSDLEKFHHDARVPLRMCPWPSDLSQLREHVAIDWRFDPRATSLSPPVTKHNGQPLVCFWEDPNAMVMGWLESHPLKNSSDGPSTAITVHEDARSN